MINVYNLTPHDIDIYTGCFMDKYRFYGGNLAYSIKSYGEVSVQSKVEQENTGYDFPTFRRTTKGIDLIPKECDTKDSIVIVSQIYANEIVERRIPHRCTIGTVCSPVISDKGKLIGTTGIVIVEKGNI